MREVLIRLMMDNEDRPNPRLPTDIRTTIGLNIISGYLGKKSLRMHYAKRTDKNGRR